MSTTITGTPSGYNPATTVTTTTAAAGEPRNIANIITPAQKFADALEFLRKYGPYVYNTVTTWTLVGVLDDTLGVGVEQRRIYMGADGLILFTANAFWTEALAPTGWAQDDSARVSSALLIGRGAAGLYDVKVWTKGTGHGVGSEWAAWSDGVAFASVFWATSTITAAGDITSSSGNLVSTAGSVSAGTTVTAGTGITATTGDIVASSGSVTATGDPTAGDGIVTCRHYVAATAAKPTTTDAANITGAVANNSTDASGKVTVTASGAAGLGTVTTVNFNKAYAAAPWVVLGNANAGAWTYQPYVTNITANGFDIATAQAMANPNTFDVTYVVIGR